jgi:hypothetical protein
LQWHILATKLISNDLGENNHRQRDLSRLRNPDGQVHRCQWQASVTDDQAVGIVLFLVFAVLAGIVWANSPPPER